MKTFYNLTFLYFLLIISISCHEIREKSYVLSDLDSTIILPINNRPGTNSTYSILKLDTSINTIKVSLIDLENNLTKFHRKYIETEGIFHSAFENSSIQGISKLYKNYSVSFWLDLNETKLQFTKSFKDMSGKHIRIKGMVDTTRKGHLGYYPAEITNIYFWEMEN